ncbi:class I SAM-dependent methyltransferase [Clostridium aestuarii]|uniref:Class I SAM-dependent methyltransferase n=1 Tax=Clostridium aestuarii TaxID=338193 RepID=A0ABT4D1R6_9CLOT|nr:class I SAM-dependent methyltransferase [Clostridium aestuarii]MCY6484235.1 class I SAM-dependent methyltransferase [Clostridium aestuarii]
MNISTRLKDIASMLDKCKNMADIGTDHAYLPIYLIKKGICNSAIASDINKGPVDKARININKEGLSEKIDCRLGQGLRTIEPYEVECVVIAGMGGNLIRDIIEERKNVFKSSQYMILQPVQNPEVLRKYIYEQGYDIIDEELSIDEEKFYEIIKVRYDNKPKKLDNIYYEISEKLISKKHPLLNKYIAFKINKCKNILNYIEDKTEPAKKRKQEIEVKVNKLEELLLCL